MRPSRPSLPPLAGALAAAALLAPFAAPPAAAEGQRIDLLAGYSFARIDEVSRHGGNLAVGFDLFGPLDGFVDAGAHWGGDQGVDRSDLTLMAGPGARFGRRGGTVFFVRALAGLVRDRASITILDVTISESRSGFGVMAGGGIDLPIAKALALRAQGDYLLWDAGGDDVSCLAVGCPSPGGGWASGFRASAGIVYRIGGAR